MADNLDEEYWANAARGQFVIRRCGACGTWQFPPSSFCGSCLSEEVIWARPSGRGKVWSWIRMHRQYFKDFAVPTPYLVVWVELAEGPRMVSTIDGPVDRLRADAPVEIVVAPIGDTPVPQFRLVEK